MRQKRDGLASLAMRMPSDLRSSGLGSVQRRLQNESETKFVLSQELEQTKKKKAVINSVWLKESY
jgi:hypothetical protein